MKLCNTFFIILLVLQFACSNQRKSDTKVYPISITIDLQQLEKDSLNLSEIAYKIEYIPLETSDSILIADVFEFTVVNNYFFIKSGQSLYRFNNNGKYINNIYSLGNGPEETIPANYAVNEKDSSVYVLDQNKQLKIYSYTGNYLSTYKKPIEPLQSFYPYTLSFFNNLLFIPIPQLPSAGTLYSLYDFQNDTLIEICNNIRQYNSYQRNQWPVLIPPDHHFQINKSSLLYKENFCDTIYSIDTSFIEQAKYVINLGNDKLNWETWRDNSMFKMPDSPINGYGIHSFLESDSHLMLNISSFKDPSIIGLFNKNDNSIKLYPCNGNKHPRTQQMRQVYLRNDLDGIISIPITNIMGYFDYYEGCLYIIVNAIEFKEGYSKKSRQIKNSSTNLNNMYPELNQISEESNPVIVKVFLK